ncbi:PQQ-dependent sugar dehydrogenase [Sandarakinorhabdus limnophila]|uniref:PQQ-dependent sugar dehydrogenase n=1 Tax=Sandarakinorhabdus limnophila TaxID=210512 RepID=UPI002354A51C|nr:PQQ-dependent sugar dehydrogenase [Sandarakinorhabdus limnophila]
MFRPLILAALIAAPAMAAPVTQAPPNVPEKRPAFAGQTRAEAVTAKTTLAVTEIVTGLNKPWGVALLDKSRFLVSEKAASRLTIVAANGTKTPVSGTPATDTRNQGGMLGVANPGDGWIYWSYAEPREGGNGTAVARGHLVGSEMRDVQVIFRQMPTLDSAQHYGGRLVFPKDGTLIITLGDRSILPGRVQAQNLDSLIGKIVRVNRDGSIPKNNPFVNVPGARPEIWSYGNRNVQGAALDAKGRLWEVEHGPQGGDELNQIQMGRDYGWPTISYGEEYSGKPINDNASQAPEMEQPQYYWDPVIGPSGMIFHSGKGAPEFKGNIFVGGLRVQSLVRLMMDGDKVVGEQRLLTDRKERIRDVIEGPAGEMYLLTDAVDGKLLKVTPQK